MVDMSARLRITSSAEPSVLGAEIVPPMLRLGHQVGRRMQRLVPKRSWRLHDSIMQPEVEQSGSRVSVVIRVGARSVRGKFVGYHLLVEKGSSRMAPQPFMRPALYQTRSSDFKSTLVMANKGGASS